jgi:hypothetical protein
MPASTTTVGDEGLAAAVRPDPYRASRRQLGVVEPLGELGQAAFQLAEPDHVGHRVLGVHDAHDPAEPSMDLVVDLLDDLVAAERRPLARGAGDQVVERAQRQAAGVAHERLDRLDRVAQLDRHPRQPALDELSAGRLVGQADLDVHGLG